MRTRGFTLTEVVLVFTLAGLLVSLTMPSAARWRLQQDIRGATREFGVAHGLAKATAVRRGRVTEFHIDATNGRFWIEVETDASGASDTVGLVRNLGGRGMSLTSTRTLLCFDGRGLPTTRATHSGELCQPADAVVRFTLAGRTEKLVFTPLGRIDRSQ